MIRRNSVYSYITDPSSHARGKEKPAKHTAENNELPARSNSSRIQYTQDDNLHQLRRKNLKQCVGPVAKNVTESKVPGKSAIPPQSCNRSNGNNTTQQKPPTPRAMIPPKARGSMSFQVQHRRSLISLAATPSLAIAEKIVRPTSATSSTIIGNSPRHFVQGVPLKLKLLGSRKISSNDIAKSAVIKEVDSDGGKSAVAICSGDSVAIKEVDSDEEKSSVAVCSGDYVADAEDGTVDDISSYASDDCGTDLEYFTGPGGQTRDAQTQTLISGGTWYMSGNKFPFRKFQKRTETCQVQTKTLLAKRSLSDTSLNGLNRTEMERPHTSPSRFLAKSTEISTITRTTECCVRPSTCPAQYISEKADVSKSERMPAILCKPTISKSFLGLQSTELCSFTVSHSQPSETEAKSQLSVPEPIQAILTPLKHNNQSNSRSTMTRGMALSLAASFLLFLGLLWTGISVSLATHRIVTVYLYPEPAQANQLAMSIRRLSNYLGLLAHWLWYQVFN